MTEKRKNSVIKLKPYLLAFAGLVFFACSGSKPQITQVFWQLNLVHNQISEIYDEQLAVFFASTDEDGSDDVKEAWLIHDASGLYWKLDKAHWYEYKALGVSWSGYPAIIMPDSAPVPRGEYRLQIQDASGLSAEREFFVTTSKIDMAQQPFPKLIKRSGYLELSAVSPLELRVYNRAGDLVYSNFLESGKYTWEQLVPSLSLRNSEFYISLYMFLPSRGYALVSYPFDFDS